MNNQYLYVQVPSNTHRNHKKNYHKKNYPSEAIKTIQLSFRGRTITFRFKIKNESGYYKIYILKTPKDPTIYGAHQAHYLSDSYGRYICWDGLIKTFKEANAVMFVWARNFRENCLRS